MSQHFIGMRLVFTNFNLENKKLFELVVVRRVRDGKLKCEFETELTCDDNVDVFNVIEQLNNSITRCFNVLREKPITDLQ